MSPVDGVTPNFTIGGATKRPPGRPAGSTNKPKATATSDDVKQAQAVLSSSYRMISIGLMMIGLPETATTWAESVGDLEKTNAEALAAAPKLAKMLANAGGTGGAMTLLLTHGMAFTGLFATVKKELNAKREAAAERERTENTVPDAFIPSA